MAKYKGFNNKYKFTFSQREIDLLVSILFDLTTGAGIQIEKGRTYVPRNKTMFELADILDALNAVGMSVQNDYLTNFKEAK